MDNSYLIPIIVFCLLGLVLRILTVRFEARHLYYAWSFLSHPRPEDSDDRETLIERTGIAMSAAKLARLASIMILTPCIYLLVVGFVPLPVISLPFLTLQQNEFLCLLIVAFVICIVFLSFSSFFMREFYRGRNGAGFSAPPKWLSEPNERIPPPVAAGGILWDWLVRGGEILCRPLGVERPRAYLFEQEDELLMAIGAGEMAALGENKAGAPARSEDERSEQEMIRAIQRLDETLVREVMRPINNVTAVPLANLTTERFLALARRTGYTRFPCYQDQITNLTGYLNVHDFLETNVSNADIPRKVHPCLFIPEVARVDLALREMLRAKSQIAICYDEFGGCSGLLSREDIIEEITGEIMDEYDRPESKIQSLRGHFFVDGSVDLDDLRDSLGLELEKKNCDTVAGYIYQRLSRTPRRGESIEEQGWRLEVLQMDAHRIRRVRLTPPRHDDESEQDAES